jgi:hypothetical protein
LGRKERLRQFSQNTDLLKRINVIWGVQPCLQKYFRSRIAQITSTSAAVSSHRGALAIVTDAGRDAMDADGLLTNSA